MRETCCRAFTVCVACDARSARERRYYAGSYLVDSVIAVVRHIEIAGAIGGDAITPWHAGQRCYLPCLSNLADSILIRHIHIPGIVSGHSRGKAETRCTANTISIT